MEKEREFSAWSFVRRVLERGAAIQQDYAAGNHASYEIYSARMDAAARELAKEMPVAEGVHPSHEWNGTALNCCIKCEAFHGQPSARYACDPAKLEGKKEPCCECGEDYPRSDLIAGHIYCEKCRKH